MKPHGFGKYVLRGYSLRRVFGYKGTVDPGRLFRRTKSMALATAMSGRCAGLSGALPAQPASAREAKSIE
jgi:hypothetical protein